jgi:hypothetical protein
VFRQDTGVVTLNGVAATDAAEFAQVGLLVVELPLLVTGGFYGYPGIGTRSPVRRHGWTGLVAAGQLAVFGGLVIHGRAND